MPTIECKNCGLRQEEERFVTGVIVKNYPHSLNNTPPQVMEILRSTVKKMRQWDCLSCEQIIINPNQKNENPDN